VLFAIRRRELDVQNMFKFIFGISAKQFLPGIEGVEGEREGAKWVVREGVGAGGRNDPSIVCTYE
jgi:hypothetical protein